VCTVVSASAASAQIGKAESGSQIRSKRSTAGLDTTAQRMSLPAHSTLSVCSAVNPAVAKKLTPERSTTSRSAEPVEHRGD